MKKSLKTPLRYPGGKSRACVKMDQHFPDLRDYTEFREPFLGGGSVAIHNSIFAHIFSPNFSTSTSKLKLKST